VGGWGGFGVEGLPATDASITCYWHLLTSPSSRGARYLLSLPHVLYPAVTKVDLLTRLCLHCRV